MKNQPVVTVVTPSLNQGRFIRETIESVLSQNYERLDYWVVDGRSTDKTLSILNSYNHIPHFNYFSEDDGGQADAIQKGWQLGRGDILAWLNADDTYQLETISRVVESFRRNPEAVLVCGQAGVIDEKGQKIGRIKPPHLSLTDLLGLVHFLPQPAVFMRAKAVQAVGGLRTGLSYAFDFDLFLRLVSYGEAHYLDDELASYRWHNEAKSAVDYFHMRLEAAQVARKFLNREGGKPVSNRRHLLSYSHLVEGYANWRLGRLRPFLKHTCQGLIYSPLNIRWVARRTFKHFQQHKDNAHAYPYDPALS